MDFNLNYVYYTYYYMYTKIGNRYTTRVILDNNTIYLLESFNFNFRIFFTINRMNLYENWCFSK